MDEVVSFFGGEAFWPALLGCGALAFVGLWLRRRGRERVETIERLQAARRRVQDVAPGLCAIVGRWRRLEARRGLVEDDSGAAVVTFADGHAGAPPDDGADVLVVGLAGGVGDDPRGAGYRAAARLPYVAVVDAGHFARPAERGLDPMAAAARRSVLVGGALFALGLALVGAELVVLLRASVY